MGKIKNKVIRTSLENVSDKDIDFLSSDKKFHEHTKEQIGLIINVATYLFGKDVFTEEEIAPYINQARTLFILVPRRTKLGSEVFKYLEVQDHGED